MNRYNPDNEWEEDLPITKCSDCKFFKNHLCYEEDPRGEPLPKMMVKHPFCEFWQPKI